MQLPPRMTLSEWAALGFTTLKPTVASDKRIATVTLMKSVRVGYSLKSEDPR